MYAKVVDGVLVKYPCNMSDEAPGVQFYTEPTEEVLAQYNMVNVYPPIDPTPRPKWNEEIIELTPELVDGKWHARYQIQQIEI
jgi:hypothetical protein